MKIFLHELNRLQPLQKVVIRSLDSSLYQLYLEIDGEARPVWTEQGSVLSARNISALREQLVGLEIESLVLQQNSAYDEMVGQPPGEAANTLEVALDTGPVIPPLDR